jgi:hypothetical protein
MGNPPPDASARRPMAEKGHEYRFRGREPSDRFSIAGVTRPMLERTTTGETRREQSSLLQRSRRTYKAPNHCFDAFGQFPPGEQSIDAKKRRRDLIKAPMNREARAQRSKSP